MKRADRLLGPVVAACRDLEQDAELAIVMDRVLPDVVAVDRRDLRTCGEALLDERARDPIRLAAVTDGGDDEKERRRHGDPFAEPRPTRRGTRREPSDRQGAPWHRRSSSPRRCP